MSTSTGSTTSTSTSLSTSRQKRFTTILIVIIAVLILSGGAFYLLRLTSKNKENFQSPPNQNEARKTGNPQSMQDPNEPPLKLKSIGVNLDYYDPATNKAGDFVFTKQKLEFNRLFMGYGFVIPGSTSSTGRDKSNPQPTFVVPLDTPVRSLVSGVVAAIPTLWSGDYSVQVTVDGKMQKWIYETEHLINPKVKVGDKVTAGQVVGEVSNFNHGAPVGFGTVEIGILKGGKKPEHVCPFAYLDDSIKEETFKKMKELFKSWEEYTGGKTLYDESALIPGCLTLDPIEG